MGSWWLRPFQKIILEHCHDKPGAGQDRMNKTTERVKRYTIWYTMLDGCLVYVRTCSVCNRQRIPQKKPNAHQVQYHAESDVRAISVTAYRLDASPRWGRRTRNS